MSKKEKCVNKKLRPYWRTGIYGWLGEEVDDNDYMCCPICGGILAMNYWDYSAEHDGDNKCFKCGQELDYSEIYDFEDTLYFKQLLEMKDEQIEQLEHRLSNCIEPKFKIGQEVWVVDNLSEKIYVGQIVFIEAQKYKEEKESIIWYQVKYFDECTIDSPFEEQFTFATEEEAKAKLEEIKND